MSFPKNSEEQAIAQALQEAEQTLHTFQQNQKNLESIAQFVEMCAETLNKNGRIYSCGNGGSLCDAMHFAEELTGRFKKDRKPLAAFAFSDPAHMSCVANDFGYDQVFARYAEAFSQPNDLLFCLSTSGNSKNILLAVEAAKKKGAKTVGLLGKDGGELKNKVDLAIIVPAKTTDRIQEMHIKIIHIVIQQIEKKLNLAE